VSSTNDLAAAAAAAVNADRVVQLTRDLVRIKSVFEPETGGNETAAAEFVLAELRTLGLEPVLEEVVPGRPNVICDWSGSDFKPGVHRTLMLEGHTDVVTEGDGSSWRYPPFEAVLADGKIHGRGSVDMKGGVAAAITALEAVRHVAPELAGRVRLGILADEEGMMLGVKHFVRQGWADDVDGAIVCEPEENEICLFQKGALRFDVHFRGVMSHGAMPYAGVNPITALTAFVDQVMRYQAAEQQRLGAHEYLGLPWFTPTILEAPVGGTPQINVMPETARVTLDVRTIPGQDHDQIVSKLEGFASDLEQRTQHLTVTVDCIESRPWTETDAADPLVQAVERAYRQVLGEPRYGGVPGATDGTFLHAWANVPVVTIGPGDRTLPHQRDEFIRVDELVAATRLYAAAIIQFLAA
jgi:succinyl-diaminopimelate desuccinylase